MASVTAVMWGVWGLAGRRRSRVINEGSQFYESRSEVHKYLTSVVGTVVVFCVGFVLSLLARGKQEDIQV